MNCRSLIITVTAVTVATFCSCKKEENTGGNNEPPVTSQNRIRFDSMAVGQVSKYLGLIGEDYFASNNIFHYTTDTLIWEVIGQDTNGYLIRESMKYAGANPESPWFGYTRDQVFEFYLNLDNDTLSVREPGKIFLSSRLVGYRTDDWRLPLNDFNSEFLQIEGWKTSLGYCSCRREAYTVDYEQLGFTYPRLNILVDNRAIAFDGNGETCVYSKRYGFVRFALYSPWTQRGEAWNLLP